MKKKIVLEFDSEKEFCDYEMELMDRGRMVEHYIKTRFIDEVLSSEYNAHEKEMILRHWMQCGGESLEEVAMAISSALNRPPPQHILNHHIHHHAT